MHTPCRSRLHLAGDGHPCVSGVCETLTKYQVFRTLYAGTALPFGLTGRQNYTHDGVH